MPDKKQKVGDEFDEKADKTYVDDSLKGLNYLKTDRAFMYVRSKTYPRIMSPSWFRPNSITFIVWSAHEGGTTAIDAAQGGMVSIYKNGSGQTKTVMVVEKEQGVSIRILNDSSGGIQIANDTQRDYYVTYLLFTTAM